MAFLPLQIKNLVQIALSSIIDINFELQPTNLYVIDVCSFVQGNPGSQGNSDV